MSAPNIMNFAAISATDFTKGFVYTEFVWKLHTLSRRNRSREFSIPGCAGLKWTLAVEKRALGETTIGLYCKEAAVCVPAVFRICILDGRESLLMNRSCFFTFGGSNGCGFDIENWAVIERRLRLQHSPLTAYLMVSVPKDRRFLSCSGYLTPQTLPPGVNDLVETQRSEFQLIQCQQPSPFCDVTIVVSKNLGKYRDGIADKGDAGKKKPVAEIRCNCSVLCMWSKVLKRMLTTTDFVESEQRVIDMSEDTDWKTMLEVLRYMYCGEVSDEYEEFKVDLEAVVDLLNVAEKYDISGLKSWCENCMIVGYDTDEQRRGQLAVAETYRLHKLKAICLAQFSSDPAPIDEGELWSAVDKAVLSEIKDEWQSKKDSLLTELK